MIDFIGCNQKEENTHLFGDLELIKKQHQVVLADLQKELKETKQESTQYSLKI